MRFAAAALLPLWAGCGGPFPVFGPPQNAAPSGCPSLELSSTDLPASAVGLIRIDGSPHILTRDGAAIDIRDDSEEIAAQYFLPNRLEDCLGCQAALVEQRSEWPETWIALHGPGVVRGRLDQPGIWPIALASAWTPVDLAVLTPDTGLVTATFGFVHFADFRTAPPTLTRLEFDASRLAAADDFVYVVSREGGALLRVDPSDWETEQIPIEVAVTSITRTSAGGIIAGAASGELVWVDGLTASVDPASQLARAWPHAACADGTMAIVDVAEACDRVVYATCSAVAVWTPHDGHRCAPLELPGPTDSRDPLRIEPIDCERFLITGRAEARVLRFASD